MSEIPDVMTERGVDCPYSPAECGLGQLACTMYGAVWFGGRCEKTECDNEFVQGKFIGNLGGIVSIGSGVVGEPSETNQAIYDIQEAGFTITPV